MLGNKILIINGPNLNMLEYRESCYGKISYQELVDTCNNYHPNLIFFQSNSESAIIDRIQQTVFDDSIKGLIINPGAYSHYSIAILDALLLLKIPKIEVHLTDIKKRENFRKTSITSHGVDHVIVGKGIKGYLDAINILEQ